MDRVADKPLISVIVPVYKVEDYIHQCVDSILAQTYENLEVILVDDGSPDRCGMICDEYAEKDCRVRVIHKENGGLSDARNVGLVGSTGAYIVFVDSDDWIAPDSVECLYVLAIQHNADLVVGEHERVEDGSGKVLKCSEGNGEQVRVMDRVGAMREFLVSGCAAWARLYRREIHEGIYFPVGEINEDEAIVLPILDRCSCVVYTNKTVYSYRCRPESITTSSFSGKKLIWKDHCAANLAFIQKNYPQLELEAAGRYRGSLQWSLTEIALSDEDYTRETEEMLKELKKNKAVFARAEFPYWQDSIRFRLLTTMPFGLYRWLIRKKRA